MLVPVTVMSTTGSPTAFPFGLRFIGSPSKKAFAMPLSSARNEVQISASSWVSGGNVNIPDHASAPGHCCACVCPVNGEDTSETASVIDTSIAARQPDDGHAIIGTPFGVVP